MDYEVILEKLEKVNETTRWLKSNDIKIKHALFHEAPESCFESEKIYEKAGVNEFTVCKHLLLRNKKGTKYYLIIVDHLKKVDKKQISELLGVSKLCMATNIDVEKILGVKPGSASIFCLARMKNDVEVIVDEGIFDKELLAFHPMDNMATFFIDRFDLVKYMSTVEQPFHIMASFEDGVKTKVYKI